MAIESLIEKLIAALEANTAAHTGKSGSTGEKEEAKSTGKTTGKTTGKANAKSDEGEEEEKPKTTGKGGKKVTREELTAIMNKVKDDLGAPVAKAIIKSFEVERLAEIDDSDIEAAYKKAKAKLDKAAEEAGGDSDDNL
jgi:hypothetical protein